jgi:hypothetical protein
MRGSRIAAAIAFLMTAQCLPIPRPADAAGPFTAWYMRGTEMVPIMSFNDVEACERAAQALAAKAGTYIGCIEGAPSDVAPREDAESTAGDHSFEPDLHEPAASPKPPRPAVSCSLIGSAFGVTCKY